MTKFTTAAQADSLPDSVMVHANRVQDMVGMNGLVDLSSAMDSVVGRIRHRGEAAHALPA